MKKLFLFLTIKSIVLTIAGAIYILTGQTSIGWIAFIPAVLKSRNKLSLFAMMFEIQIPINVVEHIKLIML